MRKLICLLALTAVLGVAPAFADLVDVGPITLGNSWTQTFLMGNHSSGSKWTKAEIQMSSGPGFETAPDVFDSNWSRLLLSPVQVVIEGSARDQDLMFSLTFNGLPGPTQIISFQFNGSQLLRDETCVITWDRGWHINHSPGSDPAPEPAPLLLVGSSLVAAAAVMRRRLSLR